MDSISQFLLGATVGAVVAGPTLGARKAAVVGGVLGTLPDLDVFFPFQNPIDNFVLHRGATHSLIVHTVLAPLLGLLLAKQFKFPVFTAIMMVWLCWITHAMLDAMTVYGTQLLWPLNRYPFGTGSVFIIDPLYSIPLLVFTLVTLFHRVWSTAIERLGVWVLLISTGYLGWSIGAQSLAQSRAIAWMNDQQIEVGPVLTTPTPLNTLFWRTIALQGDSYLNIYVPLLGSSDAIQAYRHERIDAAGACALTMSEGDRLAKFTDGFVKALTRDERAVVSDLRMGVTPSYVFEYAIATAEGSELGQPVKMDQQERAQATDWAWLRWGILGAPPVREAERAALYNGDQFSMAPDCPHR